MKPNDKIIEEKISKTWEEEIHLIATDTWAKVNDELNTRRKVKYSIGDAYAGWVAVNEVLYPRISQLLEQKEREIVEILESLKTKEYCCTSSECGDQARYDGRNNALNEAISNLKQPKE